MEVAQLIEDLKKRDRETFAAGLSEERIAAVEARLGVRLPDDIRAMYRVTDGLKLLQLAPLEQATRLDSAFLAQITAKAHDGEVEIVRTGANFNDRSYYASAGLLTNTVRLGPEEADAQPAVLVDLNHPLLVGGHILISAYGKAGDVSLRAVDFRGRLEQTWADRQAQDAENQRSANEVAVQVEALRGEDVPHLLAHFPNPGFLLRTFFHVHAPRLPGPATEPELSAAERALGRSLPPDLRTFLLLHDGYPRLFLLPAAGYFPVTGSQAGSTLLEEADRRYKQLAAGRNRARTTLDAERLRECIVIGGIDQGDPQVFPTVVWCPQLGGQIVDLESEESYPDFTALLRAAVARDRVNSRGRRSYLQ